jgi:predicted 3-demethylubiquinone-9 3-methyltransferase (glyoxalase superfamily)
VPGDLAEMVSDKNPGKARMVMEAMLQMRKLDIKALEEA